LEDSLAKLDEATQKALESQMKNERKNYTFRLRIYLAETFLRVCQDKGVSTVSLLDQWIEDYVAGESKKYDRAVMAEISEIIEAKKEAEKKSREKSQRKARRK